MYAKKIKFLLVFFIAFVSGVTFTACSSDDDEESGPSYLFQTKADQEMEKKLMETKWKLTKTEFYDEDDKIIDIETDRYWSCYLSSEKAPESVTSNKLCRLAISDNGYYSFEDAWNLFCDGCIFMPCMGVGRIISLSNGELITSTHKIVIPDLIDSPKPGMTMYWERVDVDDEEEVVVNPEDLVGYWINYSNHDQEMTELGFKADGTCSYAYEYEPDNDTDEPEYEIAKGKYKINGNKLTMTLQFRDETEIWEFTIVSVSSSKLVLKNEDGEKITFESLYE